MHIYIGKSRQKGHGIGGTIKSGLQSLKPYATEALATLGKHALHSGIQVAGDVLQGRNVSESFRQRGQEMGRGFLGEYGWQPDYPYPQYPYPQYPQYNPQYIPQYAQYTSQNEVKEPRSKKRKAQHKRGRTSKAKVSRREGHRGDRRARDIFDE